MPHYRIVDTATSRIEWFETRSKEYLTWLLLPEGEDHINDALAAGGRWRWELVQLALRLLPQGGAFLDVGAHAGAWALTVAKARPDARIEAYEPQSVPFHQLCGTIFLNGLRNVRAHQLALGAQAGRLELRLPSARNLAGATVAGPGKIIESVPVRTLAETQVLPDVLKLSVSGSELTVLEGGFAMLRQRHPYLFFEVRPPARSPEKLAAEALFKYVEKLGYVYAPLTDGYFVAFPESKRATVERARVG